MKIKSLLKCVFCVAFFCLFFGQTFAMDIVTIDLKKKEKINFHNTFSSSVFPSEIRAHIFYYMIREKLQSVISDNKKINNLSSGLFANKPKLKKVIYFYYCVLSKEIYINAHKKVEKYNVIEIPGLQERFILKNIDDFVSFDKFCLNKLDRLNHNQLQFIENIFNEFVPCIPKDKTSIIHYKYYKPLSIENFMLSFHINQFIYLPSLLPGLPH